ncbi:MULTISPECIES: hypothetical protein [Neorhizobium]|uniref:hypothetical protein n=1 Tax=Neorhizobium TaxID=1525371 RepID=UPI001053DD83|nr:MULTISPECIES: hypothetical protein [Neorhizobium]
MAILFPPLSASLRRSHFSGFLLIFGLSDAAEIVMFYQSVKLSATSKTKAMPIFQRHADEGPLGTKSMPPAAKADA